MTTATHPANVSTEVVSPIETRLNVTVPKARIDADFEKRLARFARTVKVNGFRPGKVPLARVRAEYGASIHQEVVNDVVRDTLFDGIDANKVRAVGLPNVEKVDFTDDGLVYTALVETYPEVSINALSGVEVARKTATVTDADVATMIEQLRAQRQTFAEKTTAADKNDQVTFDFEGSVDGEKFEGGTAKDFKLVIGSGRMIPGFEDGIVGMKAGGEKVIDVTFPADYQAENLAGKAAQFKINVSKVEVPQLPEFDAEFLSAFGVKEGEGVDKFKADVRKNMERELKINLTNLNKSAAFDALLNANDIQVPASMVGEEIQRQRKQLLQQFASQFGKNANFDEKMLPDELFKEKSERSTKLGVLLAKVIESSNLVVDQEKVNGFIQEMAEAYEDSDEVIKYFSTDKQQRAQIEAMILENQVADHIFAGAKVTDEETNYEAVKQQAQAQRD